MMNIEIVEDTLTPWVDRNIKFAEGEELKGILQKLFGEIYSIVVGYVPIETGYLRESGEEIHFVSTGEAMGVEMIFSGADNPRSNREAYGWTQPPIYPDQPYAQHQYFDKNRQWFHRTWGDIEEVTMDFAEMEYDPILKGWF